MCLVHVQILMTQCTQFYLVIIKRCCVSNCSWICHRHSIRTLQCAHVVWCVCVRAYGSASRSNSAVIPFSNISLIPINIKVRSLVSSVRFSWVWFALAELVADHFHFPFQALPPPPLFGVIVLFAYTRDMCTRSARQRSNPLDVLVVVVLLLNTSHAFVKTHSLFLFQFRLWTQSIFYSEPHCLQSLWFYHLPKWLWLSLYLSPIQFNWLLSDCVSMYLSVCVCVRDTLLVCEQNGQNNDHVKRMHWTTNSHHIDIQFYGFLV